MKQTHYIFLIILIVLFGIAGGIYLQANKGEITQTAPPANTALNQDQDLAVQEASRTDPSQAKYVAYSAENFQEAAASGRTVYFFYAAWCPTCRALDAELQTRLNELPDDVTILKTDYDTEAALKNTYGITIQHTLVQVDANGVEVVKWIGGGVDLLKQTLE